MSDSNPPFITTGVYKIKNAKTGNFIISYPSEKPGKIVRTGGVLAPGIPQELAFKVTSLSSGYSIKSSVAPVYLGIPQEGIASLLIWSGHSESVHFIPVNNIGPRPLYAIRVPGHDLPTIEHYCLETDDPEQSEIIITSDKSEPGAQWLLHSCTENRGIPRIPNTRNIIV